jgi:hypothetical protein
MLRFEDKQDFVEIDLAIQESDDLPSRDDAYVTIRVSSEGFAGHNDTWVPARSLRAFCTALIALERDRRGDASMEAYSPDEFKVRIYSTDSKGHMAVEGFCGYQVHRETTHPWHTVHFGFEFEPSQLKNAVRLEWVLRNAQLV